MDFAVHNDRTVGPVVKLVFDDDFDFGIQVSGRYYWSDEWGVNAEFGGGTGYGFSAGVCMKL